MSNKNLHYRSRQQTFRSICLLFAGVLIMAINNANAGCALSIGASYNYPVCTSANGSITLSPSGGVAPYSYTWSNGATTSSVSNLTAGTYTVTVVDHSKCSATRTFNMTAYMRVMNLSTTAAGDTCNASIGKATVTVVSNGVAPYSYSWNNGQTTATATGLAAAAYTVTVTDANGCMANTSATITNIGTQIQQNAIVSQPLCPNTGGTIAISPSGGTAALYRVLWSNGASTNSISSLAAGTYTATVYGSNGCRSSVSYSINAAPAAITANAAFSTPLCYGGQGSITINPSGGTGPNYSAQWNNGVSGMTNANISAGNYSVTITDQNNCSATQILTLNPGPVINAAANITAPICTTANGVLQMNPSNGRAPYQYLWSNGDTAATRSGLAAGAYYITVTDANGCTAAQTFNLSAYMRPVTLSTTTVKDTCASGKGKASVSVTSSASLAPFSYAWAGGQQTAAIGGLTPASYAVSVTDANGCSAVTSATVSNFISTINITNTTGSPVCTNPNGTIQITGVSGGKAPYSYLWSTGAVSNSLSGMAAGTYNVTVTDANTCTASKAITLNVYYTSFSASASAIGDTCSAHIGQVASHLTGGTAPMSYVWSNGGSTATITGLGAHYYSVTATDANGCSTTAGASVSNLGTAIVITGTATQPLCSNNTGTITTSVSGGTAPVYSLLWSNGATGNNLSALQSGVYTLSVSGQNGCTASQSYTITVPAPITFNHVIAPVKCDSSKGGTITQTSLTGASYPWTMSWTGPNGFTSSSMSLYGLNQGDYQYQFTDSKGCTASGTYTIAKTGQIQASYLITNTTCPGVNNGSIQRQSLVPYSSPAFHWTGANGFASDSTSIKNLAPGAYTLLITEPYGCTLSLTDTVQSGPAVSLIYKSTPVNCDSMIGGTLSNIGTVNTYYPWNMSWTGPNGFTSTATNFIHLATGTYNLHFSDSRGCSASQSFHVDSLGGVAVNYTPSPITCPGAANGAIRFVSLKPYSSTAGYSWSGPNNFSSSAQSVYNLAPGSYTVTVEEKYGCRASRTYDIQESFDVGVAAIKNINCPAPGMHMIIHPIAGDMSQLNGNHCAAGVSGQVIMSFTGPVVYQGVANGALAPNTVNGNTLTWNIADYGTLRIDSSFFIKLYVDTSAVLGSQICVNVRVTPLTGDYNPGNNNSTYCMTVIRAYDPNGKQVYPAGNITAAQHVLNYTVQFQNIGTGPAQNVYILDTLDTNIDPATFEITASSFPVQMQVSGAALRFNFNNINLAPAGVNRAMSEGWVQYSVKLRDGLSVGTQISNTANIYFDYNAPIATNTTVNTIAESTTGIADNNAEQNNIVLYPDPAHDYIYIRSNTILTGGCMKIYDATGRLYKILSLEESNKVIDIKDLAAGIYVVNIVYPSGSNISRKIVIE